MPNHNSRRLSHAAFTLIELLVVISIIAVLAGLLLPVISSVMTNARKTAAKNTEVEVVAAIKNFYTEYGVYPMPTDATPNTETCFGSNAPKQSELFDILRADNVGSESTVNARAIVYIELPIAKNQTPGQSKNGIGPDGMLYDPWGTIYFVGIDGGYTGYVNNPYSTGAGASPLQTGVIAYSWGPDAATAGDFFNPTPKTQGASIDDVISWQ